MLHPLSPGDTLRAIFGPSVGLNADWNCDAWRVHRVDSTEDTFSFAELVILDNEDEEGTYSLVIRCWNDDSEDEELECIADGSLSSILQEALT